jgi:jasmonate O-methyltransferase
MQTASGLLRVHVINRQSFYKQKVIASLTKSTRKDLVRDYYRAHLSEKMVIADLGCSTGPNALLMASDAIQAVLAMCSDLGHPPPEFQVFLNDLPWNDFNSIFRSGMNTETKRDLDNT